MVATLSRLTSTATTLAVEAIECSEEEARIRLFVQHGVLYTSEVPAFPERLLKVLPALECTLCHNDHGLPFADELCATEMGHVMEHVVLALLIEQGIYAKGVTEWNWFETPEGTFTITLSGEQFDRELIERTVSLATGLLEDLLAERNGEMLLSEAG